MEQVVHGLLAQFHDGRNLIAVQFLKVTQENCFLLSFGKVAEQQQYFFSFLCGHLFTDHDEFLRGRDLFVVVNRQASVEAFLQPRPKPDELSSEGFKQIGFDGVSIAESRTALPYFNEQVLHGVFHKVMVAYDFVTITIERIGEPFEDDDQRFLVARPESLP